MEPAQYRPITVPSNLLRLLTVRMCADMSSIAEEHQMLGPEQFGLGRSVVRLMLFMFLPLCSKKLRLKDDRLVLLLSTLAKYVYLPLMMFNLIDILGL